MADNKALADRLSCVEVLRRLRDDSAGMIADYPAPCASLNDEIESCNALDFAIAALTATPSAQAGEERIAAYDRIDRYLRNSLTDDDYADYSEALEAVWATAQPQGDASGPSRTAAIVQALDRAAAAVLPASMRPAPQVSGGGEVELLPLPDSIREASPGISTWWRRQLNAQIRDYARANVERALAAASPPEPAPTVDGGAVGHVCRDVSQVRMHVNLPEGTPLYTRPTPAPDVARLVEAATLMREAAKVLGEVPGMGNLPPSWRWPLIDELGGSAAIITAAAQPKEEG